jgi:hypothetical protein
MSDRITLRGMQFMGRHGVSDDERAAAQPFEIDLVLRLDLSTPARTDALADTSITTLFDWHERRSERSFHLLGRWRDRRRGAGRPPGG